MIKVLIADDSKVFVHEAVESLNNANWSVTGVYDGNEAIAALSQGTFDAVVLDRAMPGLSGDDVLRWIRSRPERQDLCVIMLTAYGDVSSAVESLKLGAFQYLPKPLQLLGQLRSILAAGIALHKAHATRRDLLTASDRIDLCKRVCSILTEVMQPARAHILFVSNEGRIEDVVSKATDAAARGAKPMFVNRLISGDQLIFEQDAAAVARLQPIAPEAKTLMAVPVLGPDGKVIGVLDIESTIDHAFDPCWSEVLRYLADLVGIGVVIETRAQTIVGLNRAKVETEMRAEREKREIEKRAERERLKQLDLIYREFRHSIATHVQIVSMQASELLTEMGNPSDAWGKLLQQRLRFIANNASIVEGVVQDLKALATTPPMLKLERLDAAALVNDCLSNFNAKLDELNIEVSQPEEGPQLFISADRPSLEYCLMCLINNAIEAIEEGRQQAVDDLQVRSDRIKLTVTDEGAGVIIRVQDTGIGFEPSESETLFQPLYSTKIRQVATDSPEEVKGVERIERILELFAKLAAEQLDREKLLQVHQGVEILIRDSDVLSMFLRQGSEGENITLNQFMSSSLVMLETPRPLGGDAKNRGMGLYSVRRIIVQHGGTITAASNGVGRGAVFTINLPAPTQHSHA
jgi:signal transduction histidine kinase/CheY-like chemotaxis protein